MALIPQLSILILFTSIHFVYIGIRYSITVNEFLEIAYHSSFEL